MCRDGQLVENWQVIDDVLKLELVIVEVARSVTLLYIVLKEKTFC